MATDVAALVQQGISAIKAGNKAQARDLLTKAVDLDEQSEQGWLWLSACVDSVEEQQICLENVLSINPNNEKARKGLAAIAKQTGQQPAVSAPPPTPAPQKTSSGLPTTDPFAGSPFDTSPEPAKADSPLGSGWDQFDTTGLDDSFANSGSQNPSPASSPVSSVDWGSSSSAHGSGKDVQLPSSDEYDNWVTGLSLGGAPASSPKAPAQPANTPASDPFGPSSSDSPFDSNADPFGAPASASNDDPFSDFNFDKVDNTTNAGSGPTGPFGGSGDPFGSGPFGSIAASAPSVPTSSRPSASDPFSTGPFGASDPFAGSPAPDADPFSGSDFGSLSKASSKGTSDDIFASVPGTPKRADAPKAGASKSRSEASSFSFGGASQSDSFGTSSPDFPEIEEAPARRSAPSSGSFAFIDPTARPGDEAYFKAIPPEIQADGAAGSQTDKRLLATVGLLVVLNILSLAFLLVNLTQH